MIVTVQDLIDALEAVQNKQAPVFGFTQEEPVAILTVDDCFSGDRVDINLKS